MPPRVDQALAFALGHAGAGGPDAVLTAAHARLRSADSAFSSPLR